jgi:hypothetical protein
VEYFVATWHGARKLSVMLSVLMRASVARAEWLAGGAST